MLTGLPEGSQPELTTSDLLPTGRCRIVSSDTRQSASAIWKVGRDAPQIRARLAVLLLL